MQTRTTLSALVVLALALSACGDDLTAEKASWQTTTDGWLAKQAAVKKGYEELAAKVKALPPAAAGLEADRAALDKSVQNAEAALGEIDKALASTKATVDAAIAAGKKARMQVAVSGAKGTVDGAIAKAQSLVNAATSGLESLQKKGVEADKAKARADAFAKSAAEGVKKKGQAIDVEGLHWTVEALDVERSRPMLTAVVGALKSCADLKVDLAAIATGDNAALGGKRAEALKTWLAANGVDAKVFGAVSGTVESDGAAKVTLTVANPCK